MVGCENKKNICTFDKDDNGDAETHVSITLYSNEEIVAKEVIEKIIEDYNIYDHSGMTRYKYIVVTGGTGEAWFDYFKDEFSWNPEIQMLSTNYIVFLVLYSLWNLSLFG